MAMNVDCESAACRAAAPSRVSHPLGPPSVVGDREAMGYSEQYIHARFHDHGQLAEQYVNVPAPELMRMIEDDATSLCQRIGAATRLNQIGDNRINPYAPAMIEIPAAKTHVGLPVSRIEDVLRDYPGLFLERSWIEKECPEHSVELNRFAIGRYPVTNFEFLEFLRASGTGDIPSSWRFGRYPAHRGNHPVYSVSPAAAQAYAAWLSKESGRKFRLPTEAEWEYAASGPKHLEFPWGADFGVDLANTAETGLMSTTPVGCFPGGRSPFGACDMAGNVEELVADLYDAYPGGEQVTDDLTNTFSEGYHVARGGSFTRFRDLARTRRRHGAFPREIYVIGFRLAETLT